MPGPVLTVEGLEGMNVQLLLNQTAGCQHPDHRWRSSAHGMKTQ